MLTAPLPLPPLTGPFAAIDDTKNGAPGKPWVDGQGVRAEQSGYVTFRGREADARSANDVVFMPYFANRQWPKKFAFAIQFRFSEAARETQYVLVSNDRCLHVSGQCDGQGV